MVDSSGRGRGLRVVEVSAEDARLIAAAVVAAGLYVECGRAVARWAFAGRRDNSRTRRGGRTLVIVAWPMYLVRGVLSVVRGGPGG